MNDAPHSAFNTREAVRWIAATTVENTRAFGEDRPQNLVASPVAGTPKKKE